VRREAGKNLSGGKFFHNLAGAIEFHLVQIRQPKNSKDDLMKAITGRLLVFCLSGLLLGWHPIQAAEPSWAEQTLQTLTLREKIAQMMIYTMNMKFRNENSEEWQEIQRLITTDGIGGIHLWFGDAGTSLTMMNQMQEMSKVPILFDADIEVGLNQRYPGGTPLLPLMALTATGDPRYAYEAGKIIALEGRAVGIHWNFSPVVDVNNNPDNPIINVRSFGEDPEVVSEFALQYIRGLQEHGMLATAKHFPGHGDTHTDSHSHLAEIPSDSARLWSVELKPFMQTIAAGVDAIMVAHVHAPDYQPHAGTPATLSPFWVNGILKKRLGFTGAVVTDAMAMGGVTENFTDAYALIQAIKAGCDIVIQNRHFTESVDAVEEAVRRGVLSPARIDSAALQMLRLKEKVGLHRNRLVEYDTVRRTLGAPEFLALAEEMAGRALTLVRDEGRQIPLRTDPTDTIYVIDLYDTPYNHQPTRVSLGLLELGAPVKLFPVDAADRRDYLISVLKAIPAGSRVLINAFVGPRARKDRIFLTALQTEFVRQINRKTSRVILVSFGNPYLIQDFPATATYLCAYRGHDLMQEAVLKALLGQTRISGVLPVTIPGIARAGEGLVVDENPVLFTPPEVPLGLTLKRALPYEVGADVTAVKQLLRQAVADSAWPGGVLLAAKDGQVFIHEAHGYHTYDRREPTRRGDIFDLASLTKVVATTSAIMKLYDQERLQLDDPVVKYLPQFRGPTPRDTETKAKITVRHLLTHTSGLPPFRQYFLMGGDAQARLDSVFRTGLECAPGDTTVYSDIGLIILGKLVEAVAGKPLDVFVSEEIFQPLGMNDTYFNPPLSRLKRIVPTEFSKAEGGYIRGHVHDENAYSLGGVAGHAGLFSTARDLALFAQMMLNGGIYRDVRIFQPETVELFTRRANIVPGSSRCLGWDSPSNRSSGGVYLSSHSFGHTGFTGTSLWIDPENQIFVILLTNAVHPLRRYKYPRYFDWRQRIHATVYESLGFREPNPELEWRERWQ
jgi:beta-glucosidase-like glycosyl hydrolase/CubicO group peptidase (beta-lactamase class C family)